MEARRARLLMIACSKVTPALFRTIFIMSKQARRVSMFHAHYAMENLSF
jgi:hypothetical protein